MSAIATEFLSNAPIREAVVRAIDTGEVESWSQLALNLGWVKGPRSGERGPVGDTSRVKRVLGLMTAWGGRDRDGGARRPKLQTEMSYENAVAIVRAINRDPVDFEL